MHAATAGSLTSKQPALNRRVHVRSPAEGPAHPIKGGSGTPRIPAPRRHKRDARRSGEREPAHTRESQRERGPLPRPPRQRPVRPGTRAPPPVPTPLDPDRPRRTKPGAGRGGCAQGGTGTPQTPAQARGAEPASGAAAEGRGPGRGPDRGPTRAGPGAGRRQGAGLGAGPGPAAPRAPSANSPAPSQAECRRASDRGEGAADAAATPPRPPLLQSARRVGRAPGAASAQATAGPRAACACWPWLPSRLVTGELKVPFAKGAGAGGPPNRSPRPGPQGVTRTDGHRTSVPDLEPRSPASLAIPGSGLPSGVRAVPRPLGLPFHRGSPYRSDSADGKHAKRRTGVLNAAERKGNTKVSRFLPHSGLSQKDWTLFVSLQPQGRKPDEPLLLPMKPLAKINKFHKRKASPRH
ncbi:translation initiation factor IF-2-like [Lutra lutra]|uniref:translation initiation factor IF-2-like n=1 Tax=Lutra lutra TaxID=9657 RepID=UPI001FD3BA1A|nr:translation initiation factor IF-2-like [Lutra lutra]